MSKAAVAEYLISRQPEIVRRRIDSSADFGARLGFRSRTVLSVKGVGRFDTEELLMRAREALDGGPDHRLLDVDGVEAVLARDAEGLTLRRAATARLIGLIGPTGADIAALACVAAERELSVGEVKTSSTSSGAALQRYRRVPRLRWPESVHSMT